MKILIFHLGSAPFLLAASGVGKGLKDRHPQAEVTWVVGSADTVSLMEYGRYRDATLTSEQFWSLYDGSQVDLLINLHGESDKLLDISAKRRLGIGFSSQSKKYEQSISGLASMQMNLFQIYYRLADMSWRGQGYDICYNPKARSRRNRVGLAMVNANLRNFVRDNLDLELSKLWTIPYKKSILKRMDEINKCKTVVTDDMLTMHLAACLLKNIHYLKTLPIGFELEMFGRGKVYEVPREYMV